MEIGQYLRTRRRAAALALLVPLIAAAATYWVLSGQAPAQTAMATVTVPGSTANSSSRIGIFVADFEEVAQSRAVLVEVAAKTGESVGDLRSGVEVRRLGQSSLFEVSYTGEQPEVVERVVREVVTGTYTRLIGVGADEAESTLALAEKQYAAALAARRAYESEIGTLQPERDYADLSSRILSLRADPQLGSAAIVMNLTAQRAALVPKIRRLAELTTAEDNAAARRKQAQAEELSTRAEAEEAQSPRVIRELVVEAASRRAGLVQGVGVAAVLGLVIGFALLLLPDLLRGQAPATQRRVAEPTSLTGARDAG